MEKCKYCQSENLYLEPKNEGEDALTANTVALKCQDCGKWLKWVKKEDRKKYIKLSAVEKMALDYVCPPIITVTEANKKTIEVLKKLRRELLNQEVYYRSDVITAIDREIRELGDK